MQFISIDLDSMNSQLIIMRTILLILLIIQTNLIWSQDSPFAVDGSIQIGSSNDHNPPPGTIRFAEGQFEGWNGYTWVALNGWKYQDIAVDIDGHKYNTVRIGSQIWMAENLRVTHYNDSMPIPYFDSTLLATGGDIGMRIYYDHDSITYSHPMGALYNTSAVTTEKLCPTGWRIPTEFDFEELVNFLGGPQYAGSILKERGNQFWDQPNGENCNTFGFTARGTGFYNPLSDQFAGVKLRAEYRTFTDYGTYDEVTVWKMDTTSVFDRVLLTLAAPFRSVRCIKE